MSKTQKLAAFVTTIVVILVLILISREGGRNIGEYVPGEDLVGEAQEVIKVTEITPLPEVESVLGPDFAEIRWEGERVLAREDEEESIAVAPPLFIAAKDPQPRTYTVARGDTFIGIAEKVYGDRTKWQVIFDANRKQVPDVNRLPEGQKLVIPGLPESALKAQKSLLPATGTINHTVKRGDTLYTLAEKYYGDGSLWQHIHDANKKVLPNPNRLEVGQKLVIPAR
jgi:nucleoid-associated protein YgaU